MQRRELWSREVGELKATVSVGNGEITLQRDGKVRQGLVELPQINDGDTLFQLPHPPQVSGAFSLTGWISKKL